MWIMGVYLRRERHVVDVIPILATAAGAVGMLWWGIVAGLNTRRGQRSSPRHAAPTAQVNGWTSKPTAVGIYAHLADGWTSETWTPEVPRVTRRGLGAHLAATPVRRRTWSEFTWHGMWAPWSR